MRSEGSKDCMQDIRRAISHFTEPGEIRCALQVHVQTQKLLDAIKRTGVLSNNCQRSHDADLRCADTVVKRCVCTDPARDHYRIADTWNLPADVDLVAMHH